MSQTIAKLRKRAEALDVPWVESYPVVTEMDMVKLSFGHGGRCCLLGHVNKLMGSESPALRPRADRDSFVFRQDIVGCVLGEIGFAAECVDDIISINDNKLTLEQAARVFNRVMYLAGYTEGNPESKPLPRFAKD